MVLLFLLFGSYISIYSAYDHQFSVVIKSACAPTGSQYFFHVLQLIRLSLQQLVCPGQAVFTVSYFYDRFLKNKTQMKYFLHLTLDIILLCLAQYSNKF